MVNQQYTQLMWRTYSLDNTGYVKTGALSDTQMKTIFLLQAQFDGRTEIPLAEICSDFLGLSEQEARRRASLQRLPFPVHRLGSQKSPWLVSIGDLAAHIDQQKAAAETDWKKMNEL